MRQKKDTGRRPAAPEGSSPSVPRSPGDACRCKEIAKKTEEGKAPVELLKTMLGDLSFWKKKEGPGRIKKGGKKTG